MTSQLLKNVSDEDNDRIAVWRTKRLELAQQQKIARLNARTQEKENAEKARFLERRARAEKLMPSASELENVQREIGQNQKRASRFALIRFLSIFLAPVLAISFYLAFFATSLFEAQTQIIVQSAVPQSVQNISTGTNDADFHEAQLAYAYLQSPAFTDKLFSESDIPSAFISNELDPLQRIWDFPSFPLSKHAQFDRFVSSWLDLNSGLITIHSKAVSNQDAEILGADIVRILDNHLRQQKLVELEAEESAKRDIVEWAKATLSLAEAEIAEFRATHGVFDPIADIETTIATINELADRQLDLQQRIELARLNGRSESRQFQQLIELREQLQMQNDELNLFLTTSAESSTITSEFRILNANLLNARNQFAEANSALKRLEFDSVRGFNPIRVVAPTNASMSANSPNIIGTILFSIVFFGALLHFSNALLARRASV